jgi:hypothetical protein
MPAPGGEREAGGGSERRGHRNDDELEGSGGNDGCVRAEGSSSTARRLLAMGGNRTGWGKIMGLGLGRWKTFNNRGRGGTPKTRVLNLLTEF